MTVGAGWYIKQPGRIDQLWDGSVDFSNKPAVEGVYYYYLRYEELGIAGNTPRDLKGLGYTCEITTHMFTGIIESLGTIRQIQSAGTNRVFEIETEFRDDDPIQVDQSIAHDGVCLTVTDILEQSDQRYIYSVTAVEETLAKTQLGSWGSGLEG